MMITDGGEPAPLMARVERVEPAGIVSAPG
jgi:hypothetical protein